MKHRVVRAALLLLLGVLLPGRPADAQSIPPLEAIRQQVSQVRGLGAKSNTPISIATSRELSGSLAASADVATSPSLTALKTIEMLTGASLGRDLAPLLGGDTAQAVYNRDTGALLVAAGVPASGADRLVVAHELTHALQDQYFDLRRFRAPQLVDGDRRAAARALIEGDATLTMVRWGMLHMTPSDKFSLGSREKPGVAAWASAPTALRTTLEFPYREGLDFVRGLHRTGGFQAVDRAYFDPPTSTEQILHPVKYTTREAPVAVILPPISAALGSLWRPLGPDTMGELVIRTILREHLAVDWADAAAAGWGGDQAAAFEDAGGRGVLAWRSTWDSDPDAAEFFNAIADLVATRFGTRQARAVDLPSFIRWNTPSGPAQLLKTGTSVTLLLAPDDTVLGVVAAQLDPTVQTAPAPFTPSAPMSPGTPPAPEAETPEE
ncbi:MAG: hypothetical protein U0821_01975 [Chloroflexota bacterium]